MQPPPTVTFRGSHRNEPLEAYALDHLSKLSRYSPSIVAARVVVDRGDRHHRDGNHYRVRIDLTVPGEEIVVTRDRAHGSAHVALRAAFASVRRRLQDYERRRRGQVKARATRVA
jgi:ribosome-associated translation inhibitor RaiA